MKQHILAAYRLSAHLLQRQLDGIPAESLTRQFGLIVNHPLWQVGHLALSSSSISKFIGGEPWIDPAWDKKFGMGSVPVDDPSQYPDLGTVVAAYKDSHERMAALFSATDDKVFDQPTPVERIRSRFPTIGTLVVGLMTTHEGFHVGQLSHWRRAAGLGSIA